MARVWNEGKLARMQKMQDLEPPMACHFPSSSLLMQPASSFSVMQNITMLRPYSHRTRKHICMQICVQTLWCCMQPVWTLPLTTMCSIICMRLLRGDPRPVWTGPKFIFWLLGEGLPQLCASSTRSWRNWLDGIWRQNNTILILWLWSLKQDVRKFMNSCPKWQPNVR